MMENLEKFEDILPDDPSVIPIFGYRLLVYMNEDGNMAYNTALDETSDNTPVTTVIGCLEMSKHEIVSSAHFMSSLAGPDGNLAIFDYVDDEDDEQDDT